MMSEDSTAAAGTLSGSGETASSRLAALERLIAYARDEAEKLEADVLVFCLDASLSVARGERQGRGSGSVSKTNLPGCKTQRH